MGCDHTTHSGQGLPSPPFLSSWQPDETLYSWAAAQAEIMGTMSAKTAGLVMFGRPQACRQYELPAGLWHFVKWTEGRLGSLDEIATQRTVLSDWWPFCHEAKREVVRAMLIDGQAGSVRLKAGITASGAGARRPLRYCPACRSAELGNSGKSYWHVAHQRLGTLVCLQHGLALHQFWPHRSQWWLPHAVEGVPIPLPGNESMDSAIRLALVNAVFCSMGRPIDVRLLQRAAVQRLVDIGVARSSSWLDAEVLANWFANTKVSALVHRQFGEGFKLAGVDWLISLIRSRRSGHPLHWYVFWAAATQAEPIDRLPSVIEGIIQCWPVSHGSQASLWPELSTTTSLPEQFWASLDTASSYSALAAQLRVPVGTIKRWINTEPEAKLRWHGNKTQRAHGRARDEIGAYLAAHPAATRTKLLKDCHAAVSWYRDNLPGDLERLLEKIPSDRMPQRPLWPIQPALPK